MWSGLDRVSEQVTRYGTVCGQLWYLTVFVFRLIVVVTIGANVYSDEQSAFRCSTKAIGCDNVCYDRFSKISHIRYWAFQLLAVSAPTVLFHFFSVRVRGQIEKYKELRKQQDDSGSVSTMASGREDRKLLKRQKIIGNIKVKKAYSADHELVDVTLTRRIQIAYYLTVILRAVAELVSLILTYKLFHFTDHTIKGTYNPFDAVLIKIPQVYRCDGENVRWACGQHLELSESGYVPCWVSRPWEKTIFMCYMNSLSALCFLFSVVEMFQLSGRVCYNWGKKRVNVLKRKSPQKITFAPQVDSEYGNVNGGVRSMNSYVFLPSDNPEKQQITSTIGVPTRLVSNQSLKKTILRNSKDATVPPAGVVVPPPPMPMKKKSKKMKKAKKFLNKPPIGIRMMESDPEDSEEYSSDEDSGSSSSGLESNEAMSDGNASY